VGSLWGTNASGGALPGLRVLANPRFIAPESGNLNLQATSPAIDAGATGVALTTWTSPLWSRCFAGGAIAVNGADEYGLAPATNK